MNPRLRWHDVHLPATAVLLAMTGAAYFVGVHPIVSDHLELARLEATLTTHRKRETDLTTNISKSNSRLQQAERKQADQIMLLRAHRINERVADVVDLAIEHNLQPDSTKPGRPRYAKDFGIINITVEGEGRFPDVARFLHELNTQQRDFGVRSIEIAGNHSDPFDPPSFRFELNWFILKDRIRS